MNIMATCWVLLFVLGSNLAQLYTKDDSDIDMLPQPDLPPFFKEITWDNRYLMADGPLRHVRYDDGNLARFPKPPRYPTHAPTLKPTVQPTSQPTARPTKKPTFEPTRPPTRRPTNKPTETPTFKPTLKPTRPPTPCPTNKPTEAPIEWDHSSAQKKDQGARRRHNDDVLNRTISGERLLDHMYEQVQAQAQSKPDFVNIYTLAAHVFTRSPSMLFKVEKEIITRQNNDLSIINFNAPIRQSRSTKGAIKQIHFIDKTFSYLIFCINTISTPILVLPDIMNGIVLEVLQHLSQLDRSIFDRVSIDLYNEYINVSRRIPDHQKLYESLVATYHKTEIFETNLTHHQTEFVFDFIKFAYYHVAEEIMMDLNHILSNDTGVIGTLPSEMSRQLIGTVQNMKDVLLTVYLPDVVQQAKLWHCKNTLTLERHAMGNRMSTLGMEWISIKQQITVTQVIYEWRHASTSNHGTIGVSLLYISQQLPFLSRLLNHIGYNDTSIHFHVVTLREHIHLRSRVGNKRHKSKTSQALHASEFIYTLYQMPVIAREPDAEPSDHDEANAKVNVFHLDLEGSECSGVVESCLDYVDHNVSIIVGSMTINSSFHKNLMRYSSHIDFAFRHCLAYLEMIKDLAHAQTQYKQIVDWVINTVGILHSLQMFDLVYREWQAAYPVHLLKSEQLMFLVLIKSLNEVYVTPNEAQKAKIEQKLKGIPQENVSLIVFHFFHVASQSFLFETVAAFYKKFSESNYVDNSELFHVNVLAECQILVEKTSGLMKRLEQNLFELSNAEHKRLCSSILSTSGSILQLVYNFQIGSILFDWKKDEGVKYHDVDVYCNTGLVIYRPMLTELGYGCNETAIQTLRIETPAKLMQVMLGRWMKPLQQWGWPITVCVCISLFVHLLSFIWATVVH